MADWHKSMTREHTLSCTPKALLWVLSPVRSNLRSLIDERVNNCCEVLCRNCCVISRRRAFECMEVSSCISSVSVRWCVSVCCIYVFHTNRQENKILLDWDADTETQRREWLVLNQHFITSIMWAHVYFVQIVPLSSASLQALLVLAPSCLMITWIFSRDETNHF